MNEVWVLTYDILLFQALHFENKIVYSTQFFDFETL